MKKCYQDQNKINKTCSISECEWLAFWISNIKNAMDFQGRRVFASKAQNQASPDVRVTGDKRTEHNTVKGKSCVWLNNSISSLMWKPQKSI